jgi:hypothetical protein
MVSSPDTAKTATVVFFITFPCFGDGRADAARPILRWNLEQHRRIFGQAQCLRSNHSLRGVGDEITYRDRQLAPRQCHAT